MSIEAFKKLPQQKQNAIVKAGIHEFAEKSYGDAMTDSITAACGISKGLLLHYFGSKREFYLYCLSQALEKLVSEQNRKQGGEGKKLQTFGKQAFYKALFAAMDGKIRLCMECPDEMHFVNMASGEASVEVAERKREIIREYTLISKEKAMGTMLYVVSCLSLKEAQSERAAEALLLYVNAVINKYLLWYQETPDEFFHNACRIKEEIKEYLELMLLGVC